MKFLRTITVPIALTFIILSCKKDTHTPLNVDLWKKSVDSLKLYINGKWSLIYKTGGFSPTTTYYSNMFYEFTDDNRIINTYNNTTLANNSIIWGKLYFGTDSINVLSYNDKLNVPRALLIVEIKNDSLVFRNDGSDGFIYHLIKK